MNLSVQKKILQYLVKCGPCAIKAVAEGIKSPYHSVNANIQALVKKCKVVKIRRGMYDVIEEG